MDLCFPMELCTAFQSLSLLLFPVHGSPDEVMGLVFPVPDPFPHLPGLENRDVPLDTSTFLLSRVSEGYSKEEFCV